MQQPLSRRPDNTSYTGALLRFHFILSILPIAEILQSLNKNKIYKTENDTKIKIFLKENTTRIYASS